MAKFKVTAPSGDYDGMVGNVQFSDGCAVIDDERNASELEYCRTAGYLVEETGNEQADDGHTGPQDPNPANPNAANPVAPEPNAPSTLATPGAPAAPAAPNAATPGATFDPGEHDVKGVLAHLDGADEPETRRVLDAEAAGKNRKGITDQRDAILDSKKGEDQ